MERGIELSRKCPSAEGAFSVGAAIYSILEPCSECRSYPFAYPQPILSTPRSTASSLLTVVRALLPRGGLGEDCFVHLAARFCGLSTWQTQCWRQTTTSCTSDALTAIP
ncbi:hypothetical protein GCM10010302_11910 [Streptomyces polychromogenes]|uniref:Uncharacterized protein n=1 Tax=Streptomyces polychromogenes TaxID=67342 RepID=A0ABN0V5I2_9ACTN